MRVWLGRLPLLSPAWGCGKQLGHGTSLMPLLVFDLCAGALQMSPAGAGVVRECLTSSCLTLCFSEESNTTTAFMASLEHGAAHLYWVTWIKVSRWMLQWISIGCVGKASWLFRDTANTRAPGNIPYSLHAQASCQPWLLCLVPWLSEQFPLTFHEMFLEQFLFGSTYYLRNGIAPPGWEYGTVVGHSLPLNRRVCSFFLEGKFLYIELRSGRLVLTQFRIVFCALQNIFGVQNPNYLK